MSPTAYIGLGSNLGDRTAHLQAAVRRLRQIPGVKVCRLSPLLETDPVGGPQQGRYLNAAAELKTNLSPQDLLEALLAIERRSGRDRTVRWGPRTLDLDLLLYDDLVCDEPGLTVPHPRMHERLFVLDPLCEIAPNLTHPVLGRTVRELRAGLAGGVDTPPSER